MSWRCPALCVILTRFVRGVAEAGATPVETSPAQGLDQQALERKDQLTRDLLAAVESLDRGEGADVTPEYWQSLRERARARLAEYQSAARAPFAGVSDPAR